MDTGTHLPRFDTQIRTGFHIQVTWTRRSSVTDVGLDSEQT